MPLASRDRRQTLQQPPPSPQTSRSSPQSPPCGHCRSLPPTPAPTHRPGRPRACWGAAAAARASPPPPLLPPRRAADPTAPPPPHPTRPAVLARSRRPPQPPARGRPLLPLGRRAAPRTSSSCWTSRRPQSCRCSTFYSGGSPVLKAPPASPQGRRSPFCRTAQSPAPRGRRCPLLAPPCAASLSCHSALWSATQSSCCCKACSSPATMSSLRDPRGSAGWASPPWQRP
mmetsp:Transcript_2071/g.6142  ORF Transcript_2071/g.6142 Transcript_2071/m.6142 type:complete len:229 (+) Transcript_2071:845-1531(+)